VAAYGFEEPTGNSVVDASGTGNGGTISNATRTTAGRIGSALTFNGTNSWVTVADAPSLDLTTAMTIEAWVFPTGNLTNWRNVIGKERPGGVAYYLYSRANNGRPAGGIVTGNSERTLFGTAAIPVNAWTHLATTYDGTILRMYVNGVQVATRAQTGTIAVSASPLRLGGNSPFGEFFAGRLDEVRIYNRVLTAQQITADMTRPVP